MYDIGYRERLKRRRELMQSIKKVVLKSPTLQERVEAWLNSLSPRSQQRPYHMDELSAIFGKSQQQIAAVLWRTGWTRRRTCRDDAPDCRLWYSPVSIQSGCQPRREEIESY